MFDLPLPVVPVIKVCFGRLFMSIFTESISTTPIYWIFPRRIVESGSSIVVTDSFFGKDLVMFLPNAAISLTGIPGTDFNGRLMNDDSSFVVNTDDR